MSTRGDRRTSRRGKRRRRSPSLREGASRPIPAEDHSSPEALPARQTLQVAELTRTATATSHRCQGKAVRPVGGANKPPQGAENQVLHHESGSQQGGGSPPRQGAQQTDCRGGSTAASVQSPRPGGAVNPGGRTRDDPFRRRQELRGGGGRKHPTSDDATDRGTAKMAPASEASTSRTIRGHRLHDSSADPRGGVWGGRTSKSQQAAGRAAEAPPTPRSRRQNSRHGA